MEVYHRRGCGWPAGGVDEVTPVAGPTSRCKANKASNQSQVQISRCQTAADCGEGQVDSLPLACSKPEVHRRSADADAHGRLGWLRLESFGFSVIAANGEYCRARRGSGRRLPLTAQQVKLRLLATAKHCLSWREWYNSTTSAESIAQATPGS